MNQNISVFSVEPIEFSKNIISQYMSQGEIFGNEDEQRWGERLRNWWTSILDKISKKSNVSKDNEDEDEWETINLIWRKI